MTRAHFGVLETAWEFDPGPAKPTGPATEHHFTDSVPQLVLDRIEVSNIPGAKVAYAQRPMILTVPLPAVGASREVEVSELITRYTLPDGRILFTNQYEAPSDSTVIVRVANGMCHRVTLPTGPALVIQGHWHQHPGDTAVRWDANGGATLLTMVEDAAFAMEAPGFTSSELLGYASALYHVENG